MKTSLVKSNQGIHASQNAETLCGSVADETIKTMNETPIGIYAVLKEFSGGCEDCANILATTDPILVKILASKKGK